MNTHWRVSRWRFLILIGCMLCQHTRCWVMLQGDGFSTSTTLFQRQSFTRATATIDSFTTTGPETTFTTILDPNADDNLTAWDVLAGNMARCLISSDLKRDSGFDGSSTGWTSWVEESSAFRLQKCIDKLIFCDIIASADSGRGRGSSSNNKKNDMSTKDDTIRWLKWMKSSPATMIVELSEQLRHAIDNVMTDADYARVEQTRQEFLSRIACRIFLFPSGRSLPTNLQSPPGAMVYGKLLYGGVTRFRVLGNTANSQGPKRRAGERTVIAPSRTGGELLPTEAWLQYGGPERCYAALDIGPGAVMEITILPKGLTVSLLGEVRKDNSFSSSKESESMIATQVAMCDPQWLFEFPTETTVINATQKAKLASSSNPYGLGHNNTLVDIETSFSSVLGGLGPEIESIIRRVLDGRVNPNDKSRSEELQTLLDLGLSPVRGLLLYGKPGCGKTALAREISRLLTERPVKIVSAPELLDRWVGGSERLVRDLFADAEAELQLCNGDIAKSGLHVVVIDELDAVFRKRSSSSGSGEVARASAVNQILAKMDGVKSLGNVLVIGTTNRRELLDEAILRPGRLEVQIHVPLPDKEGRREILQIYFAPLRQRGRLSQPLCRAIDGRLSLPSSLDDSMTTDTESSPFKRHISRLPNVSWTIRQGVLRDLAAERWTGGFSGADLEGLVRCAGSLALSRARKDSTGIDGLLITLEDVRQALQEVKI